MAKILEIFKEPILKFFSSGLDISARESTDLKKIVNLQVLNVFSAVAVLCIIITYSYYYFNKPEYLNLQDNIFSPLFLIIFLALIIYLRITKNDAVGNNIVVLSLFSLFYVGVIYMDEGGAVYIFIFLIPFIVVYLKGAWKGLGWLMFFYLIYAVVYFLARLYIIKIKYQISNLDHIFLGSVIASFFACLSMYRIEKNTKIIQRQLDRITEISKTDFLTKIYNKRAFLEQLERERERAMRQKKWIENRSGDESRNRSDYSKAIEDIKERFSIFSIVVIDIDFFKIFNDSYGHLLGDKILKAIGEVLNSRQFLRDNDIAGRFAGEEFMLLLPETDAESALVVAERIRNKIESLRFVWGKYRNINITLSAGIAEFSLDDKTGEDVIKRAEIAVNWARESGRDRSVIYSGEMTEAQ